MTINKKLLVWACLFIFVGYGVYRLNSINAARKRIFSVETIVRGWNYQLFYYEKQFGTFPSENEFKGGLDVIKLPRIDPWRQEYVYKCPGNKNPRWFDFYSVGEDGKPNTSDDIGNWVDATNPRTFEYSQKQNIPD